MSRRTRPIAATDRSYSDMFGQGGGEGDRGGGESTSDRGTKGNGSGSGDGSCNGPNEDSGGGGAPSGNLLNFELTRNVNTEWLVPDGRHTGKLTPLLLAYIGCIAAGQFIALVLFPVIPPAMSWTATNVVHGFLTMMYLHWIKGSPDFLEPGGEMNGMTLWEQLDTLAEGWGITNQKLVLLVVPTVLCHAACHFADYDRRCCLVNVVVWAVCIVAKMPFMHGVRLLGINRTAGIDDDYRRGRKQR